MHGRLRITALATALATLAAAAPAAADETLGLGQAAARDGVVTSFTVTGADGQAVRLRSLQGAATTATTDPVTVPASGGAIDARLPIGAGGQLALVGASGAPTVSATVEPDPDGDAYGDTTQDACPGNAADHVAPCDGTTTFGSALTLAPGSGLSGSGGRLQALQRSAAGTIPAAAEAGVLVRWRVRVQPGKGDTVLQLLRPIDATQLSVVAESQPVHVTDAGVVTVNASVPVQPGDRLAVRTTPNATNNDLGAVAPVAGDELSTRQPPVEKGGTWTPSGMPSTGRLLVQADVEPDADGNGLGDVTQDSADLQLRGAPASSTAHIYALRNLGPGTAYDVVVTIAGGAPTTVGLYSGVTCGPGNTCRIARFPAMGYVLLGPTFAIPSFPAGAGPFTVPLNSSATVSATTPDPDLANNGPVAISTSYTVGGTPITPKPPAACANVVRGTRDDDVLRGTVFPDRLVGNDGDDLLKGGAADDCLEGGAGADVLDGGDGNDRLSGASGKDRLIGAKGDDKLTGGKGNDRLSGGAGNDTLSPGAGKDAIDGGAGNDIINSVDGVRETVTCGAGQDTVRADRRDRLRGCEKVTRKK